MINQNDLRYVKTEALIRSTYLSMLGNKKSAITVTELCKIALINKSTFYSHYDTIEVLHKTLCQERIHEMLSSGKPGINLFFEDTRKFFEAISELFTEYGQDLVLLYPNWIDIVEPFEKELLLVYDSLNTSDEQKYTLRFCLGGILHLMSSKITPDSHEIIFKLVEKCAS